VGIARGWTLIVAIGLAIAFAGCRSAYYSTMEAFGVAKRDILAQRVTDARDAQAEARDQFADALEAFRSVQDFDGGDLEKLYRKLRRELDESEAAVAAVKNRIVQVERVSGDLFREWRTEARSMEDRELRAESERLLAETQERYQTLIAAMKRAESRMDPVLSRFRDRVTFLKHNLDARAIASLTGALSTIETDVASLVEEMERSIAEADAFLGAMP
jgi:hypothetical protein